MSTSSSISSSDTTLEPWLSVSKTLLQSRLLAWIAFFFMSLFVFSAVCSLIDSQYAHSEFYFPAAFSSLALSFMALVGMRTATGARLERLKLTPLLDLVKEGRTLSPESAVNDLCLFLGSCKSMTHCLLNATTGIVIGGGFSCLGRASTVKADFAAVSTISISAVLFSIAYLLRWLWKVWRAKKEFLLHHNL